MSFVRMTVPFQAIREIPINEYAVQKAATVNRQAHVYSRSSSYLCIHVMHDGGDHVAQRNDDLARNGVSATTHVQPVHAHGPCYHRRRLASHAWLLLFCESGCGCSMPAQYTCMFCFTPFPEDRKYKALTTIRGHIAIFSLTAASVRSLISTTQQSKLPPDSRFRVPRLRDHVTCMWYLRCFNNNFFLKVMDVPILMFEVQESAPVDERVARKPQAAARGALAEAQTTFEQEVCQVAVVVLQLLQRAQHIADLPWRHVLHVHTCSNDSATLCSAVCSSKYQ